MGLRPSAVLKGVIIGIDPGRRGALVAIKGGEVVASLLMPFNDGLLDGDAVMSWLQRLNIELIVLERQQSMPGQGVASTFKIGFRYGELYGMIRAMHLPVKRPSAREWTRVMLQGAEGEGKARAISVVKKLLPGLGLRPGRCRVDQDGLADAGLLALYGQTLLDGVAKC